jgi:hypothetical protein
MVNTIGFREFEVKLRNLDKNMLKKADGIVEDAALDWEQRAKLDAPKDQGALVGAISTQKIKDAHWEVVSPLDYSGFVEWGTKSRRKVPSDLTSYAASIPYQKSGDYYDFLNAILDWVKRKGIGRTYNVQTRRKNRQSKDEYLDIAQAIANSIMRHGIYPHPYFFIQKPFVEKSLYGEMATMLSEPL